MGSPVEAACKASEHPGANSWRGSLQSECHDQREWSALKSVWREAIRWEVSIDLSGRPQQNGQLPPARGGFQPPASAPNYGKFSGSA